MLMVVLRLFKSADFISWLNAISSVEYYRIFEINKRLFQLIQLVENGQLPRNQIGMSSVQVNKIDNEKFTVVCSRSPQNLKFGHFTSLFCRVPIYTKLVNTRAELFFS